MNPKLLLNIFFRSQSLRRVKASVFFQFDPTPIFVFSNCKYLSLLDQKIAPHFCAGRFDFQVLNAYIKGVTSAACKPLGPSSMVNSTFWPSIRLR